MATFRFGHYIDIHWNGYDIVGDGGTIFSIPDQLYEEFEGDLRPVEPTLEWIDTNEFLTLKNSVTNYTVVATSPISVASTTSTKTWSLIDGGVTSAKIADLAVNAAKINSQTATNGYVLTANGSAGAAWAAQTGSGGGISALVGTSPISTTVVGANATVSLNANYSTSTHLHDADYVNVTGDTMSGQLLVSSATTTSTVGFGEIIVAKGTSYGSITVNAADDHLHLRSKNPIEILAQSSSTMQGIRARGLGVNSTHTYPTLIDDGITFGEDANLYRSAANALKTDDALEVVGSLTNGGTSVSLSTHTHAYQPAGTYVTSVAGTAPIVSSTTTAGAATVSVSTGTTSVTVAIGNHLHTGVYQPSGTYVTSVAGDAAVAASGTTAISLAHTTTDGYHHVPATSTTNNGKFLKSGATAGSEAWAAVAMSDITTGNYIATATGSTGVTITGSGGNAGAAVVSIGQAVATTSNVTFVNVTGSGIISASNISSGSVDITPVANATTGVAVTGLTVKTSAATATAANASVLVTAVSGADPFRSSSYSSATFSGSNLTGFTVNIFRTNTTVTSVNWLAIGR